MVLAGGVTGFTTNFFDPSRRDLNFGAQANNAPSTNDFTGGTVDALVDFLFLGRGRVGTNVNTGIGTLTRTLCRPS
jgi:hypothetical protein